MLASGMTTRCLTRWRRAAGSVLPPVIFAVPFLATIDSAFIPLSSWAALAAAVLALHVCVKGATPVAAVVQRVRGCVAR